MESNLPFPQSRYVYLATGIGFEVWQAEQTLLSTLFHCWFPQLPNSIPNCLSILYSPNEKAFSLSLRYFTWLSVFSH